MRVLQNSNNFSHLLFNKSLLKVCNDKTTTAQSCCFGFFNADFQLTRVRLYYIFWPENSYAKNLPNMNGKEIIVASPSATLSSFL